MMQGDHIHHHHHIYFRLPERSQKPIELATIKQQKEHCKNTVRSEVIIKNLYYVVYYIILYIFCYDELNIEVSRPAFRTNTTTTTTTKNEKKYKKYC